MCYKLFCRWAPPSPGSLRRPRLLPSWSARPKPYCLHGPSCHTATKECGCNTPSALAGSAAAGSTNHYQNAEEADGTASWSVSRAAPVLPCIPGPARRTVGSEDDILRLHEGPPREMAARQGFPLSSKGRTSVACMRMHACSSPSPPRLESRTYQAAPTVGDIIFLIIRPGVGFGRSLPHVTGGIMPLVTFFGT